MDASYAAVHTSDPGSPRKPENIPCEATRTSPLSFTKPMLQCIVPPVLGLAFAVLGLVVVFREDPIVISSSTAHVVVLSQAFTALFAVWHFLALIPAQSMFETVLSEEWYRRLEHGTTFARANAVSSNFYSMFGHTFELMMAWSSRYYKVAWIGGIVVFVLAGVAPGAIHVEIGRNAITFPLTLPALPKDSIYSNYSAPFTQTDDTVYSSTDVAPFYLNALLLANTYVGTAPPKSLPNTIVPRPLRQPGMGYRYSTDVAFLNYSCDWHAPQVAEPDTMTDFTAQNLSMSAQGISGKGYAPLIGNTVYMLVDLVEPDTGEPSFDGYVVFAVTSGPPIENSGFIDLSEQPIWRPSPAWQAVIANYTATQNSTGTFQPADSISLVVCEPRITLEPWRIELLNGTMTLASRLSTPVGNLDRTQLSIAITDSFNALPLTSPINGMFGVAITLMNSLFSFTPYTLSPAIAKSALNITTVMNTIDISNSAQAYLDGYPFGNVTQDHGELLIPAVVLAADSGFIYATAAMYVALGAALIYLSKRRSAKALTIRNVLFAAMPHVSAEHQQSPVADAPLDNNCGSSDTADHDAGVTVQRLAAVGRREDGNEASTERRVRRVIGARSAFFRHSTTRREPALDIDLHLPFTPPVSHPYSPRPEMWKRVKAAVELYSMPLLGSALIAFSVLVLVRPRSAGDSRGKKATVVSTLFTWAMGIWRSVSLMTMSALVKQVNSDEWSRLLALHRSSRLVFSSRTRGLLDVVSTNTLSYMETLRAFPRTTRFFKLSFITALLTALCAIVAQGTATLLTVPFSTPNRVTIGLAGSMVAPVEQPWSADENLAPYNYGKVTDGRLAAQYVYLEHIMGAPLTDTLPSGSLVSGILRTNDSYGIRFPTDVAHVDCQCEWVAPMLPEPSNSTTATTYTQIQLASHGIMGLITVPRGIATFAPVSNMTYANSTPITSGLFAWALWGGTGGHPVNLESVSNTELSSSWQGLIASKIAPDWLQSNPILKAYESNLTHASTLLCDPNLTFSPKMATSFGGSLTLEDLPPKSPYSKGVGNQDEWFTRFLVYDYAVQQARFNTGVFRPYLFFGPSTGNAVLQSDPNNPANGTVPRLASDIQETMNKYIATASKMWLMNGTSLNYTLVDGEVIRPSFVIAAALPQVALTAALHLLLFALAWILRSRALDAPFTLTGLLMHHDELRHIFSSEYEPLSKVFDKF